MACSKYMSTKEKTHAARVSRLLVDPCTDLFRDILRNHVTEIQFPHILQKKKSALISHLFKVQREQLYPTSGNFNGTYEEFDLSLLGVLLRNISGIKAHKKGWDNPPDPLDRSLSANIYRIREIRNTYCGHKPRVFLSEADFQTLWQDLTVIISELESSLPGGCTTYTDAAKMLKTLTMDPEKEKMFLDIIDKQYQTIDELKEMLRYVKMEQSTRKSQMDELKYEQNQAKQQRSELESEQKLQRTDLKNLSANLAKLEKRYDSERENIIETTLLVLKVQKQKKVNIRTSGVQTAIEKVRDNHIAILTGKAGTGKTTTAHQVMCEMSDSSLESSYTPVLIHSPEQWDKVINPNDRFIVYLDDLFGSTNLDTGAVEKWKNHLHKIVSCAMTGNILVLIGLRRNILLEAKKCFMLAIIDDQNVVDLSSEENFTAIEKEKMLEAYEGNCTFKASELTGDFFTDYADNNGPNAVYRLSTYEKREILSTDSYYGFPLTCCQFFSQRDFFQLGPFYFQHPDENLFDAIEKMRRAKCGNVSEKIKYCVLCYVFNNGNIEASRLSRSLLNVIYEKLRISNILDIDLEDAINDLDGLYLSRLTTNHLYEFSHETILETVMVSFGKLAPDIVIKRCCRQKLHELIRTEDYKPKPGEVVLKIPRCNYEDLAQRLLRDDHGDCRDFKKFDLEAFDILQHQAFGDPEFVSVLCNLDMSDRLSSLFCCLFKENFNITFLTHKKVVLLHELLEHYGPHHTTPVQQMSEPMFKISIEDIKNVLQNLMWELDVRSSLGIILSYICKYLDLPDKRGLLQTKKYNGLTILHYCVIYGWEDLVDMILEMHKPTKTEHNWSCAHLAAYAGRSLLLQKFIDLGENITEKTEDYGFSVLQTALLGLIYGHQIVYFPSYKAKDSSLPNLFNIRLLFPESNEYEMIANDLLAQNTHVSDLFLALDEYDNNIIHYLVMHNYMNILDCLLNYDKDFVLQRNNSDLPTALHVAMYLGRPEMVRKMWALRVRPRDSDPSLIDTCRQGESFCNRKIFYKPLNISIHERFNYEPCWNDGKYKVHDVKLKAIENVNIAFGSTEEFQNAREFLLDNLDQLEAK